MAKVCKIIVVRHGESVSNKQGIIGSNSPLTDKGREQARQTKQALAGFSFDGVYSSDLQRAVETAGIIAGQAVPKRRQLPKLRERYFGSWEGRPIKHYDKEQQKRLAMTHEEGWMYKYVSDMENDHELSVRFMKALQALAEANYGKTILVVAHSNALRTALMKLLDLTYKQVPSGSFKNAGYVELDYDGHNFKVVQMSGVQI